ncbi:MAG: toll/interleukin-1 receptor domain-containing protein [Anaerolineae bacterium]
MDNPHHLLPPSDPLERIHAFARDLAYGAIMNLWGAEIRVYFGEDGASFIGQDGGDKLMALITDKWTKQYPPINLLQTFGYVVQTTDQGRAAYYALTQKAFELLEKPATPPSVFISYGRKQSSAFGLLLECRLASIGVKAFIDRSIDPGDDWHSHLKSNIARCDYVVALFAPGTLSSSYVREEIQWAVEGKKNAIAIWHGGFRFDRAEILDCPDWLEAFVTSKHAIRVQEESAEGYHDATEKLLNRLGYSR